MKGILVGREHRVTLKTLKVTGREVESELTLIRHHRPES